MTAPLQPIKPDGSVHVATKKVGARSYTIWLTGPDRERLDAIHAMCRGYLGIAVSNSIIARTAIQYVHERLAEAVKECQPKTPGEAAKLTEAALLMKADLLSTARADLAA